MAEVTVHISSPNDVVVIAYPPDWKLAVVQKRVSEAGAMDPLDAVCSWAVKVKSTGGIKHGMAKAVDWGSTRNELPLSERRALAGDPAAYRSADDLKQKEPDPQS